MRHKNYIFLFLPLVFTEIFYYVQFIDLNGIYRIAQLYIFQLQMVLDYEVGGYVQFFFFSRYCLTLIVWY